MIVYNTVLLSVPFKSVGGHPWAIPCVLRMISSLVSYVCGFPLHSIIVKQSITIVIVENLADVYRVFLFIHGAARPGLEVVWLENVLDLDIHHNYLACKKGNGTSFNPRLEVPALFSGPFFFGNSAVVIKYINRTITEAHVKIIWIECRQACVIHWRIAYWEVIVTLINRWVDWRNRLSRR